MTVLSVNVNKFALLRNSRGQNTPDVLSIAKRCIDAGVIGITVHPRPDGRHIRTEDVAQLSRYLHSAQKEFNIEGYPSEAFIDMVLAHKPTQVTLVPDPPEALTSSFGWDIAQHQPFLTQVIARFKQAGIRTAIFADPTYSDWMPLCSIQTDRVELFTHFYAHHCSEGREKAIEPFIKAAQAITQLGIELNAGHDLNALNLPYFVEQIPQIREVSIGHALVCDALDFGLEKTLQRYLAVLS